MIRHVNGIVWKWCIFSSRVYTPLTHYRDAWHNVLSYRSKRCSSENLCLNNFIKHTHLDGIEPPLTVLETVVLPLNERCKVEDKQFLQELIWHFIYIVYLQHLSRHPPNWDDWVDDSFLGFLLFYGFRGWKTHLRLQNFALHPTYLNCRREIGFMPIIRFERMTYWLQISCSTNWAKSAQG